MTRRSRSIHDPELFYRDLVGAVPRGMTRGFGEAFESAEAAEPVPTASAGNTIFEFRATTKLLSDPFAYRVSIGDEAVRLLSKLDDLGIRNTPVGRRDAYVDAIAWNEPSNIRTSLTTCPNDNGCVNSSCGLVVRSLWRLLGVRDPLIDAPYRIGTVMTALRSVAQNTTGAYFAVRSRADFDNANVGPGDAIFIDRPGSQHVFTVVARNGNVIESIDGGQTAPGDGPCCSIQRRSRTLVAGQPNFASESRPITGVVKIDKLRFTAPVIEVVRPRPAAGARTESESFGGLDASDLFLRDLGAPIAATPPRPRPRPRVVAPPPFYVHVAPPRVEAFESSEDEPSYLISHDFLGNSLRVNSRMAERLTSAETAIRAAYDALGPNHASRVHYGGGQKTLREWAGILSGRAYRPSAGKHGTGSAVDLNYALQPYIVTRTTVNGRTTLGGEAAGAGLVQERLRAAEVYDRAVRFTSNAADAMSLTAPMHVRAAGESTSSAYRRLLGVSQAMNRYFRYAMLETHTQVRRPPLANIETASEAELLAAIPLTERRDETQAINDLEALMGTRFSPDWANAHGSWGLTSRETYFRILKDYEHARIPWVMGNPVARPPLTRNPTRGFLHMIEPVVVALADTGRLRWGAIDFGPGASGDVHHFDLGSESL